MPDGDAMPDSKQHEIDHATESHPGWKTYTLIAVVLTVLTAAEVAVIYIDVLEPAVVPILLALSAGKFALVVMFYMHLKFDSLVFTAVFAAPAVLAVLVVFSMFMLFKFLPLFDVY